MFRTPRACLMPGNTGRIDPANLWAWWGHFFLSVKSTKLITAPERGLRLPLMSSLLPGCSSLQRRWDLEQLVFSEPSPFWVGWHSPNTRPEAASGFWPPYIVLGLCAYTPVCHFGWPPTGPLWLYVFIPAINMYCVPFCTLLWQDSKPWSCTSAERGNYRHLKRWQGNVPQVPVKDTIFLFCCHRQITLPTT